jgi:hypothetical protein
MRIASASSWSVRGPAQFDRCIEVHEHLGDFVAHIDEPDLGKDSGHSGVRLAGSFSARCGHADWLLQGALKRLSAFST